MQARQNCSVAAAINMFEGWAHRKILCSFPPHEANLSLLLCVCRHLSGWCEWILVAHSPSDVTSIGCELSHDTESTLFSGVSPIMQRS